MSKRYKWINGETYCDSDQMYDNETGNKTQPVYVADLLNEQDQKIKDLETKLTESENKVKGFVELFDKKQHENYEQFCEIMQLKQQLHDLPKKIVEYFYDEIRHRAILEDDYCPDHNLERKYGVRKCLLENIRTTILKKFGGENE